MLGCVPKISAKYGVSMYRRFLLTLILSLCTSAWGAGLTYLSPKYPYRLDVAAGWAQVPDAVLAERRARRLVDAGKCPVCRKAKPKRGTDDETYYEEGRTQ